MSHTPAHSPEAAPEVVTPGAQPSDTTPLRQQASQLLTNPEGNQAQAGQQAMQLLAQGLKDVSGKNEVYGILELMKGASQKPELVQGQDFLSSLQQAVGDVHTHVHSYPIDAQQMQTAMAGAQGQQAGTGEVASPQANAAKSPTGGDDSSAPAGDLSGQLVQQGLSAIASGDKMSGIMALIQAAQLNPSIMNDSRFVNALQAALSQGAGKSTASAADRSGTTSPQSQTEQSTAAITPKTATGAPERAAG